MSYLLDEPLTRADRLQDERRHERFLASVMKRVRMAVRIENKKGRLSPVMQEKYLITPAELLEKCIVRISVATLYRKYRGIYIQALTEALAMVEQYDSKDELLKQLRHKIIEAGVAEKDSKREKLGA